MLAFMLHHGGGHLKFLQCIAVRVLSKTASSAKCSEFQIGWLANAECVRLFRLQAAFGGLSVIVSALGSNPSVRVDLWIAKL